MPGTPLPNGITLPITSDPVDPVTMLGNLANSFSDAIGGLGTGKRQPRRFKVANQTEKTALSGLTSLIAGDEVLCADTNWWETYSGTAWKITRTLTPIAFAMTGPGTSTGTDTQTYNIDGDWVSMKGTFTFTTVNWPTPGWNIAIPLYHYWTAAAQELIIGTITFRHASTDANYAGVVRASLLGGGATALAAFAMVDAGDAAGKLSLPSATIPFTWVAGDQISVDIRYRRA